MMRLLETGLGQTSTKSSLPSSRRPEVTSKVDIQLSQACRLAVRIKVPQPSSPASTAVMYHSEFGRRLQDELRSEFRGTHSASSSSQSASLDSNLVVPNSITRHLQRRQHKIAPFEQARGTLDTSNEGDDEVEQVSLRTTAPSSGQLTSTSSDSRRKGEQETTRKHKQGSVHGDRFIPERDELDTHTAFQLHLNEPKSPSRQKRKVIAAEMDAQKEEANETFTTLLSSELFGTGSKSFAAASGGKDYSSYSIESGSRSRPGTPRSQPSTPVKQNIFRYGSKSPSSSIVRTQSFGALSTAVSERDSDSASDRSYSPSRRKLSSSNLFGGVPLSHSHHRNSTPLDSPDHGLYSASSVSLDSQKVLLSPRKNFRALSKVPYKVLDAPDLADDFYLNLVDWSSKDVLGVGLSNCVYLWSAQTSNVTKLCEVERDRDRITSVNWSGRGDYLAVGLNSGSVQIWDTERGQLLRTFRGHTGRVGSLAWNEHILSTGSRDRSIFHRDVRAPSQSIRELKGHGQEVCGLRWNTNTNQLASGGNDNKLCVWDGYSTTPLFRFAHHRAAVKAIAWSPHQNGLLASGGGTADMHIRFFNTLTGNLLSEVDTGSQVCNLSWSRINNEIVSTHGFSGGKVSNQVQVWRYPDMSQVATLMGHTMRVLYLAMSPDGESVVSGAGDETLRFWDLNSSGKGLLSTGKRPSTQSGNFNGLPFARLR